MREARSFRVVLLCALLWALAGVGAEATPPTFYDDFSDGKWQNRTGTDPWGRPLPEWRIVPAFPGGPMALPEYFSASDGTLCDVKKESYYYALEADFPTPGCAYYKLTFDIITHIPQSKQDYFALQLLNANGDFFDWRIKNDWHNWYTICFANGYQVGLAGLSQAPLEPAATGIEGPTPNNLYHYEIHRLPDHMVLIMRNGYRVYGSWANSSHTPVGLEYEQTTAGNIELWDNPRLYHRSPKDGPGIGDGALFPDVTIEGEFTKIKLMWMHDYSNEKAWSIDNIKFYPLVEPPPAVAGRWVFYNRSAFDGFALVANSWDDDAIATDKAALLPGQTASFANYTSYSLGINGIMVDIPDLPGTPSAADFEFKVGNDGNPDNWPAAPAPLAVLVRAGKGVDGSDRVSIVWNDNSIRKQWLQVTVKATAATGLTEPDVFYFGNAIGETGNSPADANVTPTDQVGVRNNPHTLAHNPADIDDAYDFNRDRKVGPTDEVEARNNGTNSSTALQLITAP